MKTISILFLALVLSASAAPLPTVTRVKRTGPLLSPKHAAEAKAAPMARFSPAGGPDLTKRLPMKSYCVMVQPGLMHFTAEALQPANQSLLFEVSSLLTEGSWVPLAWFGPYPQAQQVFAMIEIDEQFYSIRATAAVAPSGAMSRLVVAAPVGIRINPELPGARAWRGVK